MCVYHHNVQDRSARDEEILLSLIRIHFLIFIANVCLRSQCAGQIGEGRGNILISYSNSFFNLHCKCLSTITMCRTDRRGTRKYSYLLFKFIILVFNVYVCLPSQCAGRIGKKMFLSLIQIHYFSHQYICVSTITMCKTDWRGNTLISYSNSLF